MAATSDCSDDGGEDPAPVEDMGQGDFYDLVARLPLHCWACEWISPKPGVLQSCSLVPKIGAMGLIGRTLDALEAEVVLSIGSGSGLIEWLLSPRFPVVSVDFYYQPSPAGGVDPWVLPPLHDDVRRSWQADGSGRIAF
ncbi:unnamed protein product, partial [Symbiodinium sp. KB8]